MGDPRDLDLDNQISQLQATLAQDGLEPITVLMLKDTITALEEKKRLRIAARA